jgi:hypothetical protein
MVPESGCVEQRSLELESIYLLADSVMALDLSILTTMRKNEQE